MSGVCLRYLRPVMIPLLFRSGFDSSVHVPRWTDDASQARAVDHLHNQPLMYVRDYLVSHFQIEGLGLDFAIALMMAI